jgi:phenylacetic acid degradation operon negative regulatory protein
MTGEDGALQMEELGPVATACGTTPEQLRSCLRRLLAEGVFEREGSGRRARYHATPFGHAALAAHRDRLRRAYELDQGAAPWDRRWRLVAFAIPEAERARRDAFRDRLRVLGGAAIQGGLYVSPHAFEARIADAAKELGVEGCVSLATSDDLAVGGVREPRELARRLWRLDEVSARYRAFVERWEPLVPMLESMHARREALPDAAFLPGALAMAVHFTPCFDADPLLPASLLPQPWPGSRARELLVASRRLGLALREAQGRPRLFQFFDETTARAPEIEP